MLKVTHIRVENLSVETFNKRILNNVSFEFDTNEHILMLGKSGCGKSTLLLSIMGLMQKSENMKVSGEVYIGNRSVRKMKPSEVARIFGFVFQNPESQFCLLYPEDEVAFGLENQNVSPDSMQKIINRSLEAVNFPKEKYKSQIDRLSGGQQQRLALASAFAAGSEMILMDEPTANIDPVGRREVIQSSFKAAEEGKGLFVVEHNLEGWFALLKRLIVLNEDGSILADGKPEEIFERYGKRLDDMGIWKPYSVTVYENLKDIGYNLKNMPLTIEELIDEKVPKNILIKSIGRKPLAETSCVQNKKPAIEIESLSTGYSKKETILEDVNLKVFEGDFFALIGCNGSGKSTLAGTIMRFISPLSGKIKIFGEEIENIKIKDLYKIIGYVFQNPEHQFVEDTVWSEIAYSIDQLGNIDKESRKSEIESFLKEFELEDVKLDNPFSISGGEKRRLAAASMLIGNKKILILDEPTFGQDKRTAKKLMDKLSELNRMGTTIFIITHDLTLVDKYTNRVGVIYNKKAAFCGETSKLWENQNLIENTGLEMIPRVRLISGGKAYA